MGALAIVLTDFLYINVNSHFLSVSENLHVVLCRYRQQMPTEIKKVAKYHQFYHTSIVFT